MLATIREKIQGWIAGIILGLLAIPFALWGINYYFEGGQVKVAEVNGTDIGIESYRRALDDQKRALQQMLGGKADPRLFDTPEFRRRVLDGLIDEILVAADVDAAGYRVSDAELARQIREAPPLQRDGKFDRQLYEAFVRSRGMDVRGFEASLRRDILVGQAESGYAQSAIVTPSDAETVLRLQAQQREVVYAVLRPARVRDRVKVSSEAIEQEYQTHADRYRTPERLRIQYVRLSADDIAKSIRPTEDEIRRALAEAGHDAKRSTGRTEKAAMAKAQELRAKLVAGADFAALARQHSEDPGSASQGGDLGLIGRGGFAKEFEDALFALKKPGDLSGPVRSAYGLHVIKLTGIEGSGAQERRRASHILITFAAPAADRAKIEADLRARKAEERFVELSERFHNLIYEQPDSLKPAAETLGLKIETSGWFTRAGSPDGLTSERKVIDAAFDAEVLEQGRNSPALELGRNTLVAVRMSEREPARQRPLAEVRGTIEKELLARAQQAEVERLAQAAVRDLAGGQRLEAVARQYGMDFHAPRRIARRETGVDASLTEALFKAAHPTADKPVHGSAALADGAYAVFELRQVIEAGPVKGDSAEAAAVRRALQARRGREYYDNYRAGLRERAKVKIYQDQL
jgi:peptidyl-prolyl cis-trans isomerase D